MKKSLSFIVMGALFFASCDKESEPLPLPPSPPPPPSPLEQTLEEKVAEFLPGAWRVTLKYYCQTVNGPQHIKDEQEMEISDNFTDTQAPLWTFEQNGTGSFLGEKNDENFNWQIVEDKMQVSYLLPPAMSRAEEWWYWFTDSWEVEEIAADKLSLVRFEKVGMEHLDYSWTNNRTYRYTFEKVE